MNGFSASLILAVNLPLLSSISFGGLPTVLPDVHHLAVAKGWVTDQEFANFFAVSQVTPGPNMILMMSFLGLKVGGIFGAIASALATFGPLCTMYYLSYRLCEAQSALDPDGRWSIGWAGPSLMASSMKRSPISENTT
jgi:chromate transporter